MNYGQKKNIYFEFSPHILHKSPHFAPKNVVMGTGTWGETKNGDVVVVTRPAIPRCLMTTGFFLFVLKILLIFAATLTEGRFFCYILPMIVVTKEPSLCYKDKGKYKKVVKMLV